MVDFEIYGRLQAILSSKGSEYFHYNSTRHYEYLIYRIIHKPLRDFRTRLRNNQDRHGRKEHINR